MLAVDLRGHGETRSRAWRFNEDHMGPNAAEYFIAYMSGKSLVGQRVEDIYAAADYLRSRQETEPERKPLVSVVAIEEAAVPALHAVALQPAWFRSLETAGGIRSWHSLFKHDAVMGQLENTVHGALRHYDLPTLVEMANDAGVKISRVADHGELKPAARSNQ